MYFEFEKTSAISVASVYSPFQSPIKIIITVFGDDYRLGFDGF